MTVVIVRGILHRFNAFYLADITSQQDLRSYELAVCRS